MPGLGRYPCAACHYVAGNRRMLARHAVLIHSEKVFKCPVCPFITRYAANWYRHKRDLHGLTKVTSCEVCGFFANSTAELASHKEAEHPEHLQIGRFEDKYAREKLRLSGEGLQGKTKAPRSSTGNGLQASRSTSNSLQGKASGSTTSTNLQESRSISDSLQSKASRPTSSGGLQGKNPTLGGSSFGLQGIAPRPSGSSSEIGLQQKIQKPSGKGLQAIAPRPPSGLGSGLQGNNALESATPKDKLNVVIENVAQASEDKTVDIEDTEEFDGESYGEDNPAFFEPITVIEEFGEAQINVLEDLNSLVADDDDEEDEKLDESVTFSLPLNGLLNGDEFGNNSVVEKKPKDTSLTSDSTSSPDNNLGPLKVKRSYNCIECGLLTSNPREYLYHLKNNHGEKISVFECKYCIYASKHIQKLHRHCSLVHRLLIDKDPEYQKQLEASKEKRAKPVMNKLVPILPLVNGVVRNGPSKIEKPATRSRNQTILKCSVCPYQTRNNAFLQHHEKTVHLKKRFFRCLQCGYTTSERGRYTKHIRYHSLPKMQCEFCFFKTAYKWNMERHMKNHEEGAEGAFHCASCNFTTSTKQSFKSHVTNHHNNSPEEEFVEESNPNESAEWEDMEEEEMIQNEEEESFMVPDENASYDEFPEEGESNKDNDPDMVWKDGKAYPKVLQCKICDFKAAWPFELKKHEENHRSQKKHECPLCGMRFEHIAWLTKHLRRVHQENSQAKNIAAAFEMMKPTRRRPGKEYASDTVLPIFQEVLKQNKAKALEPQPQKNSMLSTLLNKPLQPFVPTSLNKFNSRFKSKAYASATNMSRQLTMGNYYEKVNEPAVSNPKLSTKNVPTCNVCGYKTRWISELQRHMRVHSQEKPFHCPKCKYHCKWKGDLNRHLMKYHGIKVPSSTTKGIVPKLKLKKSGNDDDEDIRNDWHRVNPGEAKRSLFPSTTRNSVEDGPLDLTVKDAFPNPHSSSSDAYDDPYDFERVSSSNPKQQSCPSQDSPAPVASTSAKRKYQCPFCTFATTTASRFHVHIVQHYNRRPFCCSVCEYNSNWEWDITKHIRLKNCKDKFQNKACVLLTDESGRRNYEKYEKYLVDLNAPAPTQTTKPPGVSIVPDVNSAHNINRTQVESPTKNCSYDFRNESPTKNCSYDFRNIGSNFEDTPENIVVTPDINIPDGTDSSYTVYNNQSSENFNDAKSFFCRHCNFKHATKRVVISHLSVHAGIKPFRCRACGIASNWRHVIVRHVKDAHNGYMNEVEDRITYSQEGFAISLTSVDSNNQQTKVKNNTEVAKTYAPQFGCKICPYKCDKEFYIKFHMKQHRPREGAVYRCDFCPYFVKFKKTLIRHTKLHLPSSSTENISMDDTLDFEDMDESDQMQSRIPESYEMYQNESPDDSIAISFDQLNQFSFSDPVSSPPKIKRHICEQCPYKTDNKTQYLYHKQFHRPNSSAPFKCTVCSYWATMQHLLTQHMKVHSGSSSSETPATPKEGVEEASPEKAPNPTNLSSLATNLSPSDSDDWMDKMTVIYVKRDNEIVKMFKCNFCPMMNKKKANVRVHQKMHGVIVKNGKFACSYCDYQCLNQGGLTNHLKIHQKVPEKEVQQGGQDILEAQQSNGEDPSSNRKKFFSYFCTKCPALFKSSNDLEIHSKFHGSAMQFGCTICDYRTRQKTHLVKHLTVHSPEYMAKREAAQGPPMNPDGTKIVEIPLVKKIDQMLLLEASEMSNALKKTGEAAAVLKKCVFCPAPFFKTSTLAYHISLHGSEGEFKCGQCDYATTRVANLTAHSLIHPSTLPIKKKVPAKPRKPPVRSFSCSKCPAVFYKQDRFDRHLELHGKNYKYGCKDCDYSVRFAANLIKHRNLHAATKAAAEAVENGQSPMKAPEQITPVANKPLVDNSNLGYLDPDEKKIMFICDRCPYAQNRKDAVQSHQRRHWLRDGFKCPYCDYTSMQSGFVHSHIKMHIQPLGLFPPQAFMKYESFKIFVKEDDNKEERLLFDDQEMVNVSKHKRKRKSEDGSSKKKKLSSSYNDNKDLANNMPSNSKVPVVVLSDVLANKELMKWAPKLKIPKLKLTKCADSEKKYSKLNISYDSEAKLQTSWAKPKPSLVVKISKVENSNNEKTMYSVCTKTSEPSPVPIVNDLKDFDTANDYDPSSEDITEKDSALNGSVCDDSTKEEVQDPIPSKEVEPESSVVVPEVSDVSLCEQLALDIDKKDAGVANGDSEVHLTNGLPEDIESEL